jgi:hypothetical protein
VIVESEEAEKTESTEETADAVESSDDAASATTPSKNDSKKKTYGEVRADLLKKFLDRADRLIAEKEKDASN